MSIHVTVLYPNDDDATFDLKYYMSHHMPLVEKHWSPVGLKSWHVIKNEPGTDGSKPAFSIIAVLTFDDEGEARAALTGEAAKEILGDIPNFSNKSPTFLGGKIVDKVK